MHNIIELQAMDLEQLRSLAEELKIKGIKKKELQDLIYDIMDAEAVVTSKMAPEPKPKRARIQKKPQKVENSNPEVKETPAEKNVQNKFAVLIDDGVSGIGTTLKPNDIIRFACKDICELAFAFVAPVTAYNRCYHNRFLS